MKTIDILSIIANDEENNSKIIKEVYDLEIIRKIFGVENLKEFLNKEVAEIEILDKGGLIMKEDLLKIVNHYGIDKQLKYIHSEYFELDEAIMDFNYDPNCIECLDDEERQQIVGEKTYHIAEEIADVMVMLKQFQYRYNICDECIEDIMKKKIERQLERIDKENKNEKN